MSEASLLCSLGFSEAENCHIGCSDGREWVSGGTEIESKSPSSKNVLGRVKFGTVDDLERLVKCAVSAQSEWQHVPAPHRGLIVRDIGTALRNKKKELGKLLTIEMGKILSEGEGEIQEFIDICEFSCGLSRQLPGQVLPSERSDHILMELWNPIGVVGVITAFNFPAAVFGWNLALSMVCGNVTIWKPSELTPLISIAVFRIVQEVLAQHNLPSGVVSLICGGREIGERMAAHEMIKMVSFTGSTQVGRAVSAVVNARFGRCLLELGGNNAAIVLPDADNIDSVAKSCVFSAVGTCGQRCTTLRRLFVHESIYDQFIPKLVSGYQKVRIGAPTDPSTLCGPLISEGSRQRFISAVNQALEQGCELLHGGTSVEKGDGFYVQPALLLVKTEDQPLIMKSEVFGPILYVQKIRSLDEAIKLNNSVSQGLSSSLFTSNLCNVFKWIGPSGSDCGIVNINIGTSGAEIGGAFGGEKETGGGRESGSDAWKQYMRRSTCTINYGTKPPALAQGVVFDI